MKKEYKQANLEMVSFSNSDVITASPYQPPVGCRTLTEPDEFD